MGKSFVSMYTPPEPGAVAWQYGRTLVSRQLMDDNRMADALDQACTDLALASLESGRNRHIGPMHHPTRADLLAIRRAEDVRRWNRANIARLGRPAGKFRRAS